MAAATVYESWLDSVLATPIVGLQIQPEARIMFRLPQLVSPLVDRLVQAGKTVSVTSQNVTQLGIDVTHGYTYQLKGDSVAIDFKYTVATLDTAASPSPPDGVRPYSQLVAEIVDEMAYVLSLLSKERPPKVRRIGFVAAATMAKTAAPPGVSALLKYLAAPWTEGLAKTDVHLFARLQDRGDMRDQCHHRLSLDETSDPAVPAPAVGLVLDWQRVYDNTLAGDRRFEEHAKRAAKDAVQYFERVGAGELNLG